MGDVVDLAERRDQALAYWRCGCGCITHYVRNDGEIECARCERLVHVGGFWKMPDGERRAETDKDPAERVRIQDDDNAASLAAMLRFANHETTVAAILLLENGEVRAWGCLEAFKSRRRRGWLRRQLETARKMLTQWGVDDTDHRREQP